MPFMRPGNAGSRAIIVDELREFPHDGGPARLAKSRCSLDAGRVGCDGGTPWAKMSGLSPSRPDHNTHMTIDWTPLADLIERHDRFLVTTHVRPDGDALGSEVGMAGLLRERGKDVRVVNASRTPPRYDFLDPDGTLFEQIGAQVTPAELADREVVVILDLSAWSQLGEMAEVVRNFAGARVVIDHHVSQDDLGAFFFKDTGAEATGSILVHAIKALGGAFT